MKIFILIIIGILAGILSAMVGVGGGIIIVPALVYFLGYSQKLAQGTSLFVLLLPVGFLAVREYYKVGNVNIASALIISLAFVVGAYFSAKFFIANASDILIKRLFGLLLIFVAWKMINPVEWAKEILHKN